MDFAFFHIGSDNTPLGLISSINTVMPGSRIIQMSDLDTKPFPGIHDFIQIDSKYEIMKFRLNAFSLFEPKRLTVYLDTDMLLVEPCEEKDFINDKEDVGVCLRSFDNDARFNPRFGGINFSEYEDRTLGSVYPYLACCTAVRTNEFWKSCANDLDTLDIKFHKWYGDQEAIRNVIKKGGYKYRHLPESIFACLPEKINGLNSNPKIIHFKGKSRKPLLKAMSKQIFNVDVD